MKEECNHIIGYFEGASDDCIFRESERITHCFDKGELGYVVFNFCPICGEKINQE